MAPRPLTRLGSVMVSKAVVQVGEVVAKEVVRGVIDHTLKKKSDRGRRLGGPRSSSKKIEEGIKRVIDMGREKIEEVGGMKNLIKRGMSRIRREGFIKVAEDVLNFASQGLVRFVHPPGFAAVFKANGTCRLVLKNEPLEGLAEPRLQMEDLIISDTKDVENENAWTNVKEEPGIGNTWIRVKEEPGIGNRRTRVKEEPGVGNTWTKVKPKQEPGIGNTWTEIELKEVPGITNKAYFDSYQQAIREEGYCH